MARRSSTNDCLGCLVAAGFGFLSIIYKIVGPDAFWLGIILIILICIFAFIWRNERQQQQQHQEQLERLQAARLQQEQQEEQQEVARLQQEQLERREAVRIQQEQQRRQDQLERQAQVRLQHEQQDQVRLQQQEHQEQARLQQEQQQEQQQERLERNEQARLLQEQQQRELLQQQDDLLHSQSAISQMIRIFGDNIQRHFMIQPCGRCYEFKMTLLAISPSARSVHYQCQHCGKKMHAPAETPEASQIVEAQKALDVAANELKNQFYKYLDDSGGCPIEFSNKVMPFVDYRSSGKIEFVAPAAPLPYEQTTRTPIPEAVRSEVWRRDGGRCVRCNSNQNLQFDHIIPVSQGGATTVANLQLLCQPCNGAKGKKI